LRANGRARTFFDGGDYALYRSFLGSDQMDNLRKDHT
jgi:hypothetical protein